jgi:antitoxin ParD1/3/4
MSEIRKVSVALTAEQVDALKAAVDSGEYATTSEIVREALRDWQIKNALRQEELERLRALWNEGKASGPGRRFDVEELLASVKAQAKVSRSR